MRTASAKDPAISTTRGNLTVCIVDDEPSVVEMLQTSVERLGYATLGTTDPQEALEHIRAGRCRVVLSDLKMPAMDGLTFLEQALKHDPGTHVILMTGFYSLDSAIEAIKRGAYDYLCKPVDRARLKKLWTNWPNCSASANASANLRNNSSPTSNFTASWEKARRCSRCLTWRGKWPSITPTCS